LIESDKELIELQAKRIMTNQDLEEAIWPQGVNIQTRDLVFLFKDVENLLQLFQKESDIKGASGPEKTIRTNVQHSLAKKLQGLNMAFRSTQKVCT
jgi:RIO-like serine/threonine protein kinase